MYIKLLWLKPLVSGRYTMTSMNVPDPVMSLAILPKSREAAGNFSKALSRFQKEDPTFKVLPCCRYQAIQKHPLVARHPRENLCHTYY